MGIHSQYRVGRLCGGKNAPLIPMATVIPAGRTFLRVDLDWLDLRWDRTKVSLCGPVDLCLTKRTYLINPFNPTDPPMVPNANARNRETSLASLRGTTRVDMAVGWAGVLWGQRTRSKKRWCLGRPSLNRIHEMTTGGTSDRQCRMDFSISRDDRPASTVQ